MNINYIYVMTCSDDNLPCHFYYIGSDFEIGPFEVNFESNDMSRNLTLEIFQDLIFEPVESFELHLTVPDQYQHLKISIDASNDNVRVRINSDDGMQLISVAISLP